MELRGSQLPLRESSTFYKQDVAASFSLTQPVQVDLRQTKPNQIDNDDDDDTDQVEEVVRLGKGLEADQVHPPR